MKIQEAAFLIVIFIANIFEAMTGFAGTLLAMPASMLLIGVHEAKVILNIIALISCSYIAIANLSAINIREFFKITVFMLLGVSVGLYIFKYLDTSTLLNIYAIIIILIALKNMFIKKDVKKINFLFSMIILISAGIIHGMFLSGGSLLVIYAINNLSGKAEFRATLAAIWVVLDTNILFSQYQQGFVTVETLTLMLYAIGPLVLAIIIGNYLHKVVKQSHFLKISYILLLISGITLLIN